MLIEISRFITDSRGCSLTLCGFLILGPWVRIPQGALKSPIKSMPLHVGLLSDRRPCSFPVAFREFGRVRCKSAGIAKAASFNVGTSGSTRLGIAASVLPDRRPPQSDRMRYGR